MDGNGEWISGQAIMGFRRTMPKGVGEWDFYSYYPVDLDNLYNGSKVKFVQTSQPLLKQLSEKLQQLDSKRWEFRHIITNVDE